MQNIQNITQQNIRFKYYLMKIYINSKKYCKKYINK